MQLKRYLEHAAGRQKTSLNLVEVGVQPLQGLILTGEDIIIICRAPRSMREPLVLRSDGAINDLDYCNRKNVRTRKNFVLWSSRTFVRYKFLYCKGGVTYTVIAPLGRRP